MSAYLILIILRQEEIEFYYQICTKSIAMSPTKIVCILTKLDGCLILNIDYCELPQLYPLNVS